MTLSVTTTLQLLTIFQSLFFAAFLLLRRRHAVLPANALLAALLAVLATHLGSELLQKLAVIPRGMSEAQLARIAGVVDHTFGFLYGPLFAGFIRGLTFGRAPRAAEGFHLLPFGLALIAVTAGILGPAAATAAVFLSLGTYLVLASATLWRYRRVLEHTQSDVRPRSIAWLWFAIAGLAGAYLFDLGSFVLDQAGLGESALLSTGLFGALLAWVSGFVLAALWEPRLFAEISVQEREVAQSVEPQLLGADLEELHRLERIMSDERPYLQAQLTLVAMAKIAGLTPRRLSGLVNRGRSQTFSDWINGYRVEEAKRMLDTTSATAMTILDLLFACGFNSKSTFNAVFKQKTGLSPRDYRTRQAAAAVRD